MLLRSCRIGFHLSTDGVKGYVMSCIMNKPNHPRSFLCTDAQRNFLLPSNDPDIDPGIKGMAVSFSYIIYNTGRILYRDFSGQEQEHQRTTNIMGITYISQNSWISTPTKHRSWLIFFLPLSPYSLLFSPRMMSALMGGAGAVRLDPAFQQNASPRGSPSCDVLCVTSIVNDIKKPCPKGCGSRLLLIDLLAFFFFSLWQCYTYRELFVTNIREEEEEKRIEKP